MNSTTFYEKSTAISHELNLGRIRELLSTFVLDPTNVALEKLKGEWVSLLLNTRTALVLLAKDEQNKAISEAFGLAEFFDDASVGHMITVVRSHATTGEIRGNSNYFSLFFTFYARLMEFQRMLDAFGKLVIDARNEGKMESEDLLSFELADYNNSGIDIDRLRHALDLIHRLHDTVARVGERDSRLVVAYLDSGSNSFITVKADINVINDLRQLIIDVWDRIRFGRENALEKKLQAATAGIKFVELVEAQEKAKAIDPNAAAQLKRAAINDTIALFDTGGSIVDVHVTTVIDNRALLRDAVRLKELGAGAPSTHPQLPPPQ
jgi:hypothetical protein